MFGIKRMCSMVYKQSNRFCSKLQVDESVKSLQKQIDLLKAQLDVNKFDAKHEERSKRLEDSIKSKVPESLVVNMKCDILHAMTSNHHMALSEIKSNHNEIMILKSVVHERSQHMELLMQFLIKFLSAASLGILLILLKMIIPSDWLKMSDSNK